MSAPYEFWISPKREDDEDFYRAYRQNIPGNHFMHVREVSIEEDLAKVFGDAGPEPVLPDLDNVDKHLDKVIKDEK